MSFNYRADLILREHFESMDDYVKRGAATPDINRSYRVNFPEESSWRPWNVNARAPPSGSASVDETMRQPLGECPFVPGDSAKDAYPHFSPIDRPLTNVVNEPLTLKITHLNRGTSFPLEKTSSTCQVPIESMENKSACAPAVNAIHVPQTEQSKVVKDSVKNEKSDKRDLISAMESVLATLKVYETKKQEASFAKAQATGGFDDAAEHTSTHLKLAETAKEVKASLTDEASEIQTHLLLLLTDEKSMFKVLDDMQGDLNSQLAQVEDEINKTKLMNLQREKAQNHLSQEEHKVKMGKEKTRAMRIEAKKNKELKALLADYHFEVDMFKRKLDTMRDDIMLARKDFERRTFIVKLIYGNPSKTSVGMDFAQLEIPEQLAPFLTRSTSRSSISSEDTEGSELSDSEDSDSESEISEESEDSASESESSEDSEDSMSESESYEEEDSEDSTSESESSEESDDSEAALEVFAAVTSHNVITVQSLPDSPVLVSSQNPIVSISTRTHAEHHEHPNETSPAISNDCAASTTEAAHETKTLGDNDWDLCGLSDSDA